MRAYVGLGTNLGDREGMLRLALERLAAEPSIELVAFSTLRETEPEDFLDQPRFLNGGFALEPLAELDPELEVPGRGPVSALLSGLD